MSHATFAAMQERIFVKSRLSLGLAQKLAATLAFTLMSVMAKFANGGYSLGEVTLFRAGFALIIIALWIALRGDFLDMLVTRRASGHLLRSTIGACGMFFGFGALRLLSLPSATAFSFATPLLTVALAALILKERVRIYRWAAVAFGLAGVLVMTGVLHAKTTGATSPTSLFGASIALAGAMCAAGAAIQTRRLLRTESTGTIIFYFMTLATMASAGLLLAGHFWPSGLPGATLMHTQIFVMPSLHDAVVLAMIGVFGGLGQIFVTESFRHADASILAPFDYASMLWALFFGYVLFDEIATPEILQGAAIVVAAGLFVIWREQRLGLIRDLETTTTTNA
ncbi:MAG: DMT family transporter [Hyphomicrobiales bacterium]|nr:DMT family transporter [Hyphomicrobiales bacterium]